MKNLTAGLLLVVIAVTVLVAAGVGQGYPPHRLPISAAAKAREVAAVAHGGPQVRAGEALFDTHGCDDCHTLAAGNYSGRLGPRLDVQSQGDPISAVEGNIVDPPDDDPGYEKGLMPEDYGTRLSARDRHLLALYIHTAAAAAAGAK